MSKVAALLVITLLLPGLLLLFAVVIRLLLRGAAKPRDPTSEDADVPDRR
jgi:hypothetical protein